MTREELRAIRESLGWTQADAARELALSLRTYHSYESGEVPYPVALAMLAIKLRHDTRDKPMDEVAVLTKRFVAQVKLEAPP